ncbi:MAG: hypothetical protein KC516_02775 [Nanoarchaeota archaeon]|nr:hypothetical protein [Nanoarchaeota archaeon]
MNKQDFARRFNGYMPTINEIWASEILNIPRNKHKGPDLIDEDKFVEIKFAKYPNSNNYISWKGQKFQKNYEKIENKKGFWGFGIYSLNMEIPEIKGLPLEELVEKRELYIVKWSWANQFKSYKEKGKTKESEWNLELFFPKFSKLPKIHRTIEVKKGLIHFTHGAEEEYFKNLLL